MTLGDAAGRTSVECPQCGETVLLNGSREPAPELRFAVRKVAGEETASPADARTLHFRCPGCDKDFHESPRAAGRKTKCPQCGTGFTIPHTGGPVPPAGESKPEAEPARAPHAGDPVEAAVAAYSPGSPAPPVQPAGKRRLITRKSIVPIGLLLMLLGGAGAIVGALLAANGMQQSLKSSGLGGVSGLNGAGGLTDQTKAYARLLQDLAREDGGRRGAEELRAPPVQNQADQIAEAAERSRKTESSGRGMMIGGIIAGGIGSLLTMIGGIFLLAGLIGRFIEPPAAG